MRDIKFRSWNKSRKTYKYPKLWDNSMPSNWIDHYVLEQFTGLHDKNGKEIYEGDILKGTTDVYINSFNTPVEFYKGSFNTVIRYDMHHIPLFDYDTVWMKNGFKGDTDTCLWIYEFEIIGSIHTTPELLNN